MTNSDQYEHDFLENESITKEALQTALDVRKFEIDLYWRRTTYFLSFITIIAGGYAFAHVNDFDNKPITLLFLSSIGFIFSLSWFFANRGSKYWQENWENHVDLLENELHGPLYKTILCRPNAHKIPNNFKDIVTGPSPYSVSKLNQILSLYILIIWISLFSYHNFPISLSLEFSLERLFIVIITVVFACIIIWSAKTHRDDHDIMHSKRSSKII